MPVASRRLESGMKLWTCLAPVILSAMLSGCNTRPSVPEGTFRVELNATQGGVAPIKLCVPETTITPLSRMLNNGNSVLLINHALVWSDGSGSTLSLATTAQHPPRRLPHGVPHPDDQLSVMLTVVEGTPGYVPPTEDLHQTEENKVVDLPGEEFDLYREKTLSNLRETLRPTAGRWRGSRLAIECDTDPRTLEYFSGASSCELYLRSGDLLYGISTGRTWLQSWPEVAVAVEEAIARYRERCR
jgi:hypothetical protein